MRTINYAWEHESYEMKREQIFRNQRLRNKRVQEKRIIFMICTVFCVLAVILGAFSLKGKAEGDDQQTFKYYTSVRLNYGDTLWTMADRFMDQEHYTRASYINEVKSINHIHDENELQAGMTLIVPYYSGEWLSD